MSSSVLGTAHWVDPLNSAREYFLPGGVTALKWDVLTDMPIADQCDIPCVPTTPFCWKQTFLHPSDPNTIGWRLVRMIPGTGFPTSPPVKLWWQVSSPTDFDMQRVDSIDYISSETAFGDLVVGLRAASPYCIKFFLGSNLASLSRQTCSQGTRGNGEPIPDPAGGLQFIEALTHIEREEPGPGLEACRPIALCGPDEVIQGKRIFGGTRTHTFPETVPDFGGQQNVVRQITAAAVGYVAATESLPADAQSPACQWKQDATRGELVLFDVTDVPAAIPSAHHPPLAPQAAPALLRVALGPVATSFWSVRAKDYAGGKTYAFVGDLTGRVFVFDVSPTEIFPAVPAGVPYRPAGQPATPTLDPIAVIDFRGVVDPVDGHAPNIIDLEIDGDWLYCALARGGIGIVAIDQDPAQMAPVIAEILDTPGIAQGMAFVKDSSGATIYMLVGDTRCGFRLYRRLG